MTPLVRRANVEDAAAIARVHVRAWQAGYRGQMPDEFLDALSVDKRTDVWTDCLGRGGGEGRCVDASGDTSIALVLEDEGEVVGVATIGDARRSPGQELGELWMINLAPEAWRRGLGRLLLETATAELRSAGYREAVLWVLDTNRRARDFYEKAGWSPDGAEHSDDSRGFRVREVRYRRSLE